MSKTNPQNTQSVEDVLKQFDTFCTTEKTVLCDSHWHIRCSNAKDFLRTSTSITTAIESERAKYKGFESMNTAPKDGTVILGLYGDGTITDIFWSERPVCMLGSINGGYPEGWATGGRDTDTNLPMDTPLAWKHE